MTPVEHSNPLGQKIIAHVTTVVKSIMVKIAVDTNKDSNVTVAVVKDPNVNYVGRNLSAFSHVHQLTISIASLWVVIN